MQPCRTPLPYPAISRFSWLMGLYAENHERIERLVDLRGVARGRQVSRIGDGLDVHVDILDRHAHTVELRLSYALIDPATGSPDPSVVLRAYLDSRQVEAQTCYVGRHWQDVLGLRPAPQVMLGHRLRMNSFLNKWLAYLGELGHSRATLAPFAEDDAESNALLTGA